MVSDAASVINAADDVVIGVGGERTMQAVHERRGWGGHLKVERNSLCIFFGTLVV